MPDPTLLLLDNGSSRPDSTLNLRRLAASLTAASGQTVHPVSLQHAHKVDPDLLDGRPADTLVPFLQQRLELSDRAFLVLPLFFGNSRALTAFIPEQADLLRERFGPFELKLAPVLCPLPGGEPRLARILCDQVREAARTASTVLRDLILVDHGSPLPDVTQVRNTLARQLRDCLGGDASIAEAVMERRDGSQYDFNGPLLLDLLREQASVRPDGEVILSLLFLNPGRHAGPGGDIEQICDQVRREHPEFRIHTSALVGSHPGLVELLLGRLRSL